MTGHLRLLPTPNADGDRAMARIEELAQAVVDALPLQMTKCSRVSCLYQVSVGLGSVCDVCRALDANGVSMVPTAGDASEPAIVDACERWQLALGAGR